MRLALLVLFAAACGDGASGVVDCTGSSCVCPSSGGCSVDCHDACDLQCAGSGPCDFACDNNCRVDCTGSGPCVVDVGANSSASCPGSGGCDIACHGDCAVTCTGSGTCIVRCVAGAVCSLTQCNGPIAQCPNGVEVCGGGCPASL